MCMLHFDSRMGGHAMFSENVCINIHTSIYLANVIINVGPQTDP